jgi:hypothetical protein
VSAYVFVAILAQGIPRRDVMFVGAMEAFMATGIPVFLASSEPAQLRRTTPSQEPAQPSPSSGQPAALMRHWIDGTDECLRPHHGNPKAFEAVEWDRWMPSEAPLVPSWSRCAPLTPKPALDDSRFVPSSPKAKPKEPEPEAWAWQDEHQPKAWAWQEAGQDEHQPEAWASQEAWQDEHQPEAWLDEHQPSASQDEPQSSDWVRPYEFSLPKRKIEEGEAIGAAPKQKAKPPDSDGYPRAVKSRSVEDRASSRSDEDNQQRPWDTRGPRGPQDGGPQIWKGQKFREGSGRWANSGGQHRDKYALYHKKQREGVHNVAFYHPFAEDGYWAKKAAEDGVPSPFQMRHGR